MSRPLWIASRGSQPRGFRGAVLTAARWGDGGRNRKEKKRKEEKRAGKSPEEMGKVRVRRPRRFDLGRRRGYTRLSRYAGPHIRSPNPDFKRAARCGPRETSTPPKRSRPRFTLRWEGGGEGRTGQGGAGKGGFWSLYSRRVNGVGERR